MYMRIVRCGEVKEPYSHVTFEVQVNGFAVKYFSQCCEGKIITYDVLLKTVLDYANGLSRALNVKYSTYDIVEIKETRLVHAEY